MSTTGAFAMNQAAGLDQILQALRSGTKKDGDQSSRLSFGQSVNQELARPANTQRKRTRTIAVAAGKGGVGKTSLSVNLGLALAIAGHKTVILDADIAMGNVDVMLGLHAKRNIGDLLQGQCGVEDVMVTGPHGLCVVPAGSGTRRLAHLHNSEFAGIIHAFDEMQSPPDFLLVDNAAGIADGVSILTAAADDVIIMMIDEPTSMTDAYAQIKVLHRDFGVKRFHIVANMVSGAGEARSLFEKIEKVAHQFLPLVTVDFLGMIPRCEDLRRGIRRQSPVMYAAPNSASANAFKKLAETVVALPEPHDVSREKITFFSRQASVIG